MNFLFSVRETQYLLGFVLGVDLGLLLILFDEVVQGNVFHKLKKYKKKQIAANHNSNGDKVEAPRKAIKGRVGKGVLK